MLKQKTPQGQRMTGGCLHSLSNASLHRNTRKENGRAHHKQREIENKVRAQEPHLRLHEEGKWEKGEEAFLTSGVGRNPDGVIVQEYSHARTHSGNSTAHCEQESARKGSEAGEEKDRINASERVFLRLSIASISAALMRSPDLLPFAPSHWERAHSQPRLYVCAGHRSPKPALLDVLHSSHVS